MLALRLGVLLSGVSSTRQEPPGGARSRAHLVAKALGDGPLLA